MSTVSRPLWPRRPAPTQSSYVARTLPTQTKKPRAEGYIFVPSGNVYITRNCKRLTLAAGRTVWIVDGPMGKGIQVPIEVYHSVIESEKATRDTRKAVVDKIDKKEKDEARVVLLKLFPGLPPGEDDIILGRAWERSSGRVGRTTKLSLEQKVRRAVVAHVRHAHSGYERRLREEFLKNGRQRVGDVTLQRVRNETWKEVNDVVRVWSRGADRRQLGMAGEQKKGAQSVVSRRKKKEPQPGVPKKEKKEPQPGAKKEKKQTQPGEGGGQKKEGKSVNGRFGEARARKKRERLERRAIRRQNQTEAQKKARSERRAAANARRAQRKLAQRLALEQGAKEQEETKEPQRQYIVISDSEEEAIAEEKLVLKVIDLMESDSEAEEAELGEVVEEEMEAEAEAEDIDNAENWDIGDEDEDDGDDFFYADDKSDEDFTDSQYPQPAPIRHTRSNAADSMPIHDHMDVGGGEEDELPDTEEEIQMVEEREQQDEMDREEEMHRIENDIVASRNRNPNEIDLHLNDEEEIQLNFRNIELMYEDLRAFNSAPAPARGEERPQERREERGEEGPQERMEERGQERAQERAEERAEEREDEREEEKGMTEVEEAENDLFMEFGFGEPEDYKIEDDPFWEVKMEAAEENGVEQEGERQEQEARAKLNEDEKEPEGEVKAVKLEVEQEDNFHDRLENTPGNRTGLISMNEHEDEPAHKPTDNSNGKRKHESDDEPGDDPEDPPHSSSSEAEPERKNFHKKAYQVGGYIIEEFVRIKPPRPRSKKPPPAPPGGGSKPESEVKKPTKSKFELPTRNWDTPPPNRIP